MHRIHPTAAIVAAAAIFTGEAHAQSAVAVEETLVSWHDVCLRRHSFSAALSVRELDATGKWSSEEPWSGRIVFDSKPNRFRLDIHQPTPQSWLLTKDQKLLHTSSKPTALTKGECERANLWIGDLPAFVLLCPEPELLSHRYQVRVFDSAPGSRSVYLYPQRREERLKIGRIEVELDASTSDVKHVHVVYVEGRQCFFTIVGMDSKVRIAPSEFERL